MNVTIAVVSYNVAPLLDRCLRTCRAALDEIGGGSIVVVDNASVDGSMYLVQSDFPDARLIVNDHNRGFGAACNQALSSAEDAILILNPDAELVPGALPALVSRLAQHPSAALVGAKLEYPDGRDQPSRRRFPSLWTLLVESTPLQWHFRQWLPLSRYYCLDLPERAGRVDWLSGACLLGRVTALRQVGGFDPDFFMYFEEVDLARRLVAHGWDSWYEPAARVIHHHSRSADQDVTARDRNFYRSKYRFIARYWGRAAAGFVRLMGAALFAAEWASQRRHGATGEASRYGALVRWHLFGDR
jgi:N-acetylglucosaminyl-diphospho-decaprenol L-rhamnosyltransferase